MRFRKWLQGCLGVLVFAGIGSAIWACGGYSEVKPVETRLLIAQLGEVAQEPKLDLTESTRFAALTETLRGRRQTALDAVIEYRSQRVRELGGSNFAEIKNLDSAIDKIAGQKFATHSRLYWHTSIRVAKLDARETNRPILSLRMLGRLDQDLSCANSRFFRTILYPDPEIAAQLRENFVLHWEPVRDVPVVTIDFGNGRRLRQPLTGNSVHLVLDHRGRPIDALPGLVSPQSFKDWLAETSRFWGATEAHQDGAFWSSVASYHRDRADRRRSESSLAISKTDQVSELNPLDERWSELAASQGVRLASTSQQLLQVQRPAAENAMRIAASKAIVEAPMLRLVQPIERAIARDTVFNLYALQTKIDDWFAASSVPTAYEAMTDRIYAEVFQMPLDDPWLGLSPDTQYTALDNGGRIESASQIGPNAVTRIQFDMRPVTQSGLDSKLPR